MTRQKTERTCPHGHTYIKSSDCPNCPICEKQVVPQAPFLKILAAPARRALEREGITSLQILATYTEKDIQQLHGIGQNALTKLKELLLAEQLDFKLENSAI
ncbi:MAG: hypothetical protein HYZ42_05200 [Bacteroidetes bacterium]|nr:hypothetical protein [Bacteroidota bacterium]